MGRSTEKLEIIDISKLIPYANNARTHSDEQIKKIQSSIREFGFVNPVLIDKNYGIIAGHGRVEAAKREGMTEVPCVWVEHLTEAQKKAYILADNRLALDAGWDMDVLKVELEELKEINFDIDLTGFNSDELSDIFGEEELEAVEDDYEVELPEEPKTKLGDIYQLGRHRLMCGDSTDKATVEKLMNGVKADMVLTDPPYGMNLDTDFSGIKGSMKSIGRKNHTQGNKYNKVIGDNEDFTPKLITTIFDNFGYCKEMFLFGADYYAELLPNKNDGSWLVWDKRKESQADAIGSEFELCWSKQKHKRRILRHDWFGFLSSENTYDARHRVHPTQKPITLLVDIINQWGKSAKVIVDIYGGSGSTLIACEQLNRACYMMELDPKYCDVIIDRWEALTGKKAELLDK
jgi:DNA modification methylase